MKPEFFTRGAAKPKHVILRRHGVAIAPTKVNEEHMERIRAARRRLGLDEGISDTPTLRLPWTTRPTAE